MPCTHEASLFHSFYSQSIIISLYSLVYSPATSSQLPHSPPRVASKNLTLRRVSLSLSPFPLLCCRNAWSSVLREAQARQRHLPHLPLRLSFLSSSPPVTDTTRYQRRVTWFFPPDQFQVTSTLVCRVFLNFRRRVTPPSVQVKYARHNAIELARERTI